MNFYVSEIDQTVQQFLYANKIDTTPSTFLDMKRRFNAKTNWEVIQSFYTAIESNENQSKYPSGELLIKQGTGLVIENSVQDRDIEVQVIDTESTLSKLPAFISQKLADLLNDPGYEVIGQDFSSGNVVSVTEQNDATVYIWCRAVNDWIDVSHHISQVTTSVTAAGGVFSIVIDDIESVWDEFGTEKWEPIEHTPIPLIRSRKDGSYKRPNFYFNTILAENDLVYIKLGRLVKEEDDRHHSTIVPANKIWDMIGLIDRTTNQVSINSTITSVQGRDLIKLLIEDGSIFFSSQFLQNIFVDLDTFLARRNLFTNIEQSLIYNFSSFKSVELLLQYVVNKYSNLGIIPNSAFYSYGASLATQKYDLKKSSISSTDGGDIYDQLDLELPTERQGVWQIIDFVFDKEPGSRLVSDSSFSQDNGSMINSIRKLCQEPFIEFKGDTYGDRYNFVVRKQPFDKNGYIGLVYGFVDTDLIDPAYSFDKKVDNSKTKLKVKNQIRSEINRHLLGRKSTLSNYCIDIDDSQVLSHQLSFHSEAYSWYRLIPRGLGTLDETMSFALTPIIAFDEYASIWGSRTLSIESNYTPSSLIDDKKTEEQLKYLETQGFLDLQFLIQSNAYLPFTRKGTIVLTGNRTIKRGLFIFFKPTNEVFYVDSVSHLQTIGNSPSENNRVTTLQVSRGMVEPFIKGLRYRFGETFEDVSYFNIINTEIANSSSIDSKDTLKNWKVNRNVFDFFVQRRQFSYGR